MTRVIKICLGACVVVIIVAIVIVTLALTIFKTRDPVVDVNLVGLKKLPIYDFFPGMATNVSLDTVITMGNPNYANFKFRNSNGYVNYANTIVGEVPIRAALIPARSTITVKAKTNFMIQKLIQETQFFNHILDGPSNFTSTTILHGKAIVLKFIKLKATTYTSCNISVNVTSMRAHSKCVSKIKLF